LAKVSAEAREQIRYAARHPVRWMRGDGLPEEKIRPWKMAVQIVPNLFTGLRTGFTWNWHNLFQNVFGVNKRQLTVGTTTATVLDVINDPAIGAYMDAKNYPISTSCAPPASSTASAGFGRLLPLFSFGLSPWQHIVLYIVVNAVATSSPRPPRCPARRCSRTSRPIPPSAGN